MRIMPTMPALAALLLCAACASQPATTTKITPTVQQFSAVQWEDVTSASSVARVSNAGFIALR